LVAAVLAAGLATSMAQNVYSLNVVGYYNVEMAAGWNLVANQLDQPGDNTVATVFGDQLPNNAQVFKFVGGSWSQSDAYLTGVGWLAGGTITVNPGEGVFVNCPEATTVTFVGEVKQGELSIPYGAGYSVVSSQVPQAGGVESVLGYAPQAGDQLVFWSKGDQSFATSAAYVSGLGWLPSEPSVGVGESFFVSSDAGGTWTRNFAVPE